MELPPWRLSPAALRAELDSSAWTLRHVYDDEEAEALAGFSAVHASGFVLDVLWVSSVPQALLYVNTPLDSDRGDAHTCEHLLLGKGARGRAVASLEEMSLVSSTAFTGRLRTCYTFQCAAGLETFCAVLAAKLAALMAPDATDEEIRREVCHCGLTGELLEEKGTVYNEMLAAFQQPSYCGYHALHRLLYAWPPSCEEGKHPLSYEAGGTPQAIRTALPEHLRAFHGARYMLGAAGAIVALTAASPRDLLRRLAACLDDAASAPRPWAGGAPAPPPAWLAAQPEEAWLPPPVQAPDGTCMVVRVPLADASAPGQLVVAWPGVMPPAACAGPAGSLALALLQLLMHLVADGATSELHAVLIAQGRLLDCGATSVSGYVCSEPGRAVIIALGGLPPASATEAMAGRIGAAMRDTFARLAAMPDASPQLKAFNKRALSQLCAMRRSSRQFLAAPPRFGVRGVHDAWLTHLLDAQRCATAGAERIHLSFVAEAAELEAMLTAPDELNFWGPRLKEWGLTVRLPVSVVTVSSDAFADQLKEEQAQRMKAVEDNLIAEELSLSSDADVDEATLRSAAFARFRTEYAAATAVIDTAVAATPMPPPPPDPPMTEDDELDATHLSLPGGGRLLLARFPGLTGGHVGLSLALDGVPPRLYSALASLPAALRCIGLTTRTGEVLGYSALCSRLQTDVLYCDPCLMACRASGRCELTLRAAGLTQAEALSAVNWMEAMLTAPDFSKRSLPRIRDAIDTALGNTRAFSDRRAEFWLDGLACTVLPTATPLQLLMDCSATRAHVFLRLRWRLREPPSQLGLELLRLLGSLRADVIGREALDAALSAAAPVGKGAWPPGLASGEALHASFAAAAPADAAVLRSLAADLRGTLAAIPDASLGSDWTSLVAQLTADAAAEPETVLSDWRELLTLLRHRGRARGFIAAGFGAAGPLTAALRALVARLSAEASPRGAPFAQALPHALLRARERSAPHAPSPGEPLPSAVAIVMHRLASGGVVSMTGCACAGAESEEQLLNALAAAAVAGGGSHSLFMRGWAAGIAYSCGISASLSDGRLRYYADTAANVARCLTVAAGDVTADAAGPPSAWRAEYALAQCFTSRAGRSTPESRAEAAASDEADGRGMARQRALRTALLRLRARPDLAEQLHARAPTTLGALLPGVTAPWARPGWSGASGDASGATLVVVGSESQAAGVEALLQKPILRIFERDLWLDFYQPPPPPRPSLRARVAAIMLDHARLVTLEGVAAGALLGSIVTAAVLRSR